MSKENSIIAQGRYAVTYGLRFLPVIERRVFLVLVTDKDLKTKNIHLMGIGGAGMSGLAILLDQIGARVSGCDMIQTSLHEGSEKRNIQ